MAPRPPFVGRGRELALLRAGLNDARGGRGRLFLISGEPGVGKTSLGEQISNEASEHGISVLWGRCWEGGGTPAYWPIIQVIRKCAARSEFAQIVETLGGGIAYLASLVPEVIRQTSARDERAGPEHVAPEQARFRLFDAVATLLKNLASREPMLIAIDDLHDANGGVLQMMRFLARALKDAPILLIGIHREAEIERSPELRLAIAELAHEGDQLSVIGLSLAEVAELVRSRAGITPDEQFVAMLHRTTEGNPLFLNGLLQMLASEGKLGGQQRLTGRDLKLPHDVRRAIRLRLEGMSERTATMLSIASGLGIEFDLAPLERVSCARKEEIFEGLDEAVALNVIAPVPEVSTGFRFTHTLVRSAIYEEMASAERAQLHKQIGEALEAIYSENVSAHLAEIANHFRLAIPAGTAEKAIDYSIRASKAAEAVYAYEEAISHGEATLALIKRQGGDSRQRADFLVRLGTLLQSTNTRLGIEHLESALAAYEELNLTDEAARVQARLGGIFSRPGQRVDTSRALVHLRKAETVLGKGPRSRALADLYFGLGNVADRKGLLREACAAFQRGMEIGEQLGNDEVWCQGAAGVAMQLVFSGRLREARNLLAALWARLPVIKEPQSFFYAVWAGGGCHIALEDARGARPWFSSGLESPLLSKYQRDVMNVSMAGISWRLGDYAAMRQHVAHWRQFDASMRTTAEALYAIGEDDWQRARLVWQTQLEPRDLKSSGGDQPYAIRRAVAAVLRETGEIQKAEEILLSLLTPCDGDEPLLHLEISVRPALALAMVATGKVEPAQAQISRCSEILAAGEDWRGLAGQHHRAAAVCAAAAGNNEDSECHFATAIQIFRRLDLIFDEAYAFRLLGRTLASAGRFDAAREKFDRAIELHRQMGTEQTLKRVIEEKERAIDESEARKRLKPEGDCVFRQEGEYWTLSYGGKSARLHQRGGMRFISLLLARPGESLSVVDMFASGAVHGPLAVTQEGLHKSIDLGDAGEELDERALRDYRGRIAELESQIERAAVDGEPDAVVGARAELDMLSKEISSGVGLHGRLRRAASHRERARVNATRQIKSAIAAIRKVNPPLGRHLANSIYTGTSCRYAPPEPVTWEF